MTKELFHLRQFRLLLLVLLCALFSLPLSAQEAYVEKSKDETTLTFYYDNNRSSRNGKTWGIDENIYNFFGSRVSAWAGTYYSPNKVVTKVVFDASFQNFHPTTTNSWFYNLKALTTIEGLENLTSSAVTDMGEMFSGCSSLTSLNVSNFNTSAVTDMRSMFSGCSDLRSLNLSNFNTSAVTAMSEMFYGCSGLKELNLSNFNTAAVTNMSGMFRSCSGLTVLNLSNFNTSKVTDMSSMFSGCSGLTALNLSNFNTSKVTNMSSMFSGCSGLTALNLSNFNTSKVTNMSSMFWGCFSLKTIFNTNTWRSDNSQNMFYGCAQLKGAVKYDGKKLDATMANPTTGYFADPRPKAYVLQSEDKQTLTFFYDAKSTLRSGKTWGIDEKEKKSNFTGPVPVWAGAFSFPNGVVTKVVFDTSFKNFRPTTTKDWFYNLSALTTIEGLENLNTSAVTDMREMFSGCSRLKELNLSNFNTSKVTDMRAMFQNCSSLTSLNFSNFNTSKVTDMREMFSRCSGLKELNLSNFNTSAVTDMSYIFQDCSSLTSLNLSNFNTSAVTNMSEMFNGCSGLTSLNVSSFNTSAVTDMSWMFKNCSGLNELNVSNLNTSKVTGLREMFSGCSSLKELNVSNFNTSAVTNMSGMFSGCSGLTSLSLSNFNTAAVTNMSGMFRSCSGLTVLNLSNFNTATVTDMSSMFSGCSSLTELNVSNFNTSKVTNMEGMFSGCSRLKTILNTNTWRCDNSRDMFFSCKQLRGAVKFDESTVDATMANPETGYFTDSISRAYVQQSEDQQTLTFYYDVNRAFRSGKTWGINEKHDYPYPAWTGTSSSPNKGVTKIVFDASFKNFRPTTTKYWFSYLKALTTIECIENLNTSNVTDMSGMFSYCSNLTSLNILNFNTSAVTNMRGMFYGCSRLTSLNISNFNTSAVTNMSWMFYGCSGLTELNVSNFNTSAVTDMGWMFHGCSGLAELNVSNFNTSAVWNMSEMFYGCSGLMSLNVSNFNTSAVTDMRYMFYGCSGLTSLNVSNFNTSKVTDMRGMFTNCSGLKAILNLNTWRCERSQDMFKGCTQLNGAVKYDESKLDVTMANPTTGYFTDPNRKIEAYVLQSKDQHTLTFYYDNNRRLRSSFTWDIDQKSSSSKPAWAGTYKSPNNAVTKVVFDASFKDFRPTTTKGWFYRLSELTTIEGLENLNTSAVTDMSTMFSDCSSLTSLNLSNFNTSAVTNMSEMFSYCSGLKTILNPNTWRCEKSQDMFIGCTQLKGAVKYYASKVDVTMANPTIGYFRDSNKKYLDAYVLQSEDQHTLTFYYDNNRKLRGGTTWDINEKSISLNPVWAGTYYTPNNAVTKVVFDASFKDFLSLTTNSWFSDLKALTTIEGLQNLNTSEVTDMRNMFSGCSSLTELNVSNFNTSKVTDMSLMFYDCSGLKELNVSNFNTSAVESMSDMFFGCSGLKELNVSNFNTSAVEFMSGMFSGCSGLKELNVSNFNTSAVESMSGMFSGCSGLTSLNLSNFNISEVWNMSYMFSGCSGLKTILNPNIWRCEQSQNMFKGCTQLKGAVKYDASKVDATMANPTTGYFSWKLPTAIGRVVFDDNNATQIYNLQGKRVNGNQRHLPAGFYIVNGKKVYLNEKP